MLFVLALLLPFLGTVVGAASVFFLKRTMSPGLQVGLSGFSAGIMTAASVWSLILPAIALYPQQSILTMITVVFGFWTGWLSLYAADLALRHCSYFQQQHHSMTVLAVCIHNFPEGMAVGAVAAGFLRSKDPAAAAAMLALSAGMALQNLPEGAIISLPMASYGKSRFRPFAVGTLSAVIESAGTFFAILLASHLTHLLPFLLCFAAGAMLYVVVRELIPEAQSAGQFTNGIMLFGAGFSFMMILDVLFG